MDQKTAVMEMINEVGVNSRVGEILVTLSNDNPISSGMIEKMNKEWKYVYWIGIGDMSN